MNTKAQGYLYTIAAVTLFAFQDALSKHLGASYSPVVITMYRYWAIAAFVLVLAVRTGGIAQAASTRHLPLQVLRGLLLVGQIVLMINAFDIAGLAMTQSIIQGTPLLITLLSVPLLGEKVGWRRLAAVVVGLIGVLIIINPVGTQFSYGLLLPIIGAFSFAIYSICTRAVSRGDSPVTSFFYTGVVGAIAITCIGPFFWTPFAPIDWFWMAVLCICGTPSHFLLIKAYDLMEAAEVQPLTYLQLVIGAVLAVNVFGETLTWNMIVGALIVVGAGLFTIWREYQLSRRARRG